MSGLTIDTSEILVDCLPMKTSSEFISKQTKDLNLFLNGRYYVKLVNTIYITGNLR